MSKPALRSDVNVIKEGEVLKLAGFFRKTWEPRWFRLRGRQLLYYKNQLDTNGPPRQILNLRGAHAFRAAEGKIDAKTEFCVEIELVEPVIKSYYFCTLTEEYLNEWIDVINKAAQYSMKEICKLKGHEEQIICNSFNPQCDQLITGTNSGCIKIWDLKLFKVILSIEAHRDTVTKCGYFAEGQKFFSVSLDKTLKIWESGSFQLLKTVQGFDDGIVDCIYVDSCRYIITASASGSIKIWNSNSLQAEGSLQGHNSLITSLSACNDSKKLLSTAKDGSVICWNLQKLASVTAIRHPYAPVQGLISSNGKRFVLWDKENSVLVYSWEDTIESKFDMTKHSATITSCFFTPNSAKIVTSSEDKSILIWDCLISGQLLTELGIQSDIVKSCCISRNQQLMISVAGNTVSVWDFKSMELLKQLEHTTEITKAIFIPDSSGIIAMQEDGTMQIWSL